MSGKPLNRLTWKHCAFSWSELIILTSYEVWGGGDKLFSGCASFPDSEFRFHTISCERIDGVTKFCICIDIDKIQVGIVKSQFSSNSNRVMAFDDPWFLSEFRFHTISCERIDGVTKFCICIDIDKIQVGIVKSQFSSNSNRVMAFDDPWFLSEFRFRSISWERINGVCSNFANALILTRSRLGLLRINYHQIVTELLPLMIHDFCQNFVSAQYLENKLMEFDQFLHMHWYWQDLGRDCYASIFTKQ